MKLSPIEQALYTRLNNTVGGSFVGIYTDVPDPDDSELDSAYPFLTLGPHSINTDDDKDQLGGNAVLLVHVWTRTHDNLARAGLRDAVYDALHRQDLLVAGTDYVNLVHESSDGFDDPDGKTRHDVMQFRMMYAMT